METTVQVRFKWIAQDDASEWERIHGDPPLHQKMHAILTELQGSIHPSTLEPLPWSRDVPFDSAEDLIYRQAVETFVTNLLDRVLSEACRELRALAPGVFALAEMIRPDSGHWRTKPNAGGGCSLHVDTVGETLCEPCGTDCHKVDGKIYKSCPKSGKQSLLTWYSTSRGKPVAYAVGVLCELQLRKGTTTRTP